MEGLAPEQVPFFMWKTGTSSARRDAWAVGHNGRFAAGVWVGHFSGAPDPALLGAESAEPLLAELFALPAVRNEAPLAPGRLEAPTWAVTNPLPAPAELDEPPRILSPSPGATFLAINGQAIIHARANRPASVPWVASATHVMRESPEADQRGLPQTTRQATAPLLQVSWFLNGRLIASDAVARLTLAPGAYELRCADPLGRSSAVRFAVR